MNTRSTRTILYEAFGSIMISISFICLSINLQAQHEILNSGFEFVTDSKTLVNISDFCIFIRMSNCLLFVNQSGKLSLL